MIKDEPKDSVCDNCKREPEAFMVPLETEGEYSREIPAHWMVVDKEEPEPNVLMSEGELMFRVYVEKEHPISEKEMYLCHTCFDAMFCTHDEDDEL